MQAPGRRAVRSTGRLELATTVAIAGRRPCHPRRRAGPAAAAADPARAPPRTAEPRSRHLERSGRQSRRDAGGRAPGAARRGAALGLVQRLPLPDWARDVAGVVAMDYTLLPMARADPQGAGAVAAAPRPSRRPRPRRPPRRSASTRSTWSPRRRGAGRRSRSSACRRRGCGCGAPFFFLSILFHIPTWRCRSAGSGAWRAC